MVLSIPIRNSEKLTAQCKRCFIATDITSGNLGSSYKISSPDEGG